MLKHRSLYFSVWQTCEQSHFSPMAPNNITPQSLKPMAPKTKRQTTAFLKILFFCSHMHVYIVHFICSGFIVFSFGLVYIVHCLFMCSLFSSFGLVYIVHVFHCFNVFSLGLVYMFHCFQFWLCFFFLFGVSCWGHWKFVFLKKTCVPTCPTYACIHLPGFRNQILGQGCQRGSPASQLEMVLRCYYKIRFNTLLAGKGRRI